MSPKICPRCGSIDIASILYGMPAFNDKLMQQLNSSCITGNDPTHHCNQCAHDFDPLYPDELNGITDVFFSCGGYDCGYPEIRVSANAFGALAQYTPSRVVHSLPFERQLTCEEWQAFVQALLACEVLNWKKKYADPDILDGTQWNLEIAFLAHKPLKIYGSNQFPPFWAALLDVFRTLEFSPDFFET